MASGSRRRRSRKSDNPFGNQGCSPLRLFKSVAALAALLTLAAVAAGLVIGIAQIIIQSRDLPSVQVISAYSPEESTRIYFADEDERGRPKVMAVLAATNRKPVKLSQINPWLIKATIAVEDVRFYQHHGVDYVGIVRALFRNIAGGDITGQGASTITQQLARNIEEFELSRQKVFSRKIREAVLARRIESLFSKDEILELYLNTIYYGNGAYGAEAAAQVYFQKPASKLTLGEAAYLAGLPQRPAFYSQNQSRALARRAIVLDRMVAAGYITPAQAEEARKEEVPEPRPVASGARIYGAPYFVGYVVRKLKSLYGEERLTRGLQVYTTLDSRMQEHAERVLREGVRRSGYANQGCLVCVDNKTGDIRAMVGGLDYKRDQFNIVTQGRRQPGSSFKPIVYTAAIDTGVCDLNTTYRDDPDFPWRGRDRWIPKNYGGRYSYANVTVRDAIRRSLNTIAVKVAVRTGLKVVTEYARRMGITTPLDEYPPLALGASAVHPIDLCKAYSVFPNEGELRMPRGILRVLDPNGELLDEPPVEEQDTRIQPSTIQQMNEALREVVRRGTGTAAASIPGACGKTGTTNDNRDAWFAGYTPELTAVVWVAREQRSAGRVRYLSMPGATGGRLCAPIWRDFMARALEIQAEEARKEEAREAEEKLREKVQESGEEGGPAPIEQPAETLLDGEPQTGTEPTTPPGEGAPATGTAPPEPAQQQPTTISDTHQPAPPPPRPEPPRPDPGSELIRVRLCAETGDQATIWCPVTIDRTLPRRSIPRMCRTHRPPPGEGR